MRTRRAVGAGGVTDTLLIRDGRFAEYWLNADGLRIRQQLQVA